MFWLDDGSSRYLSVDAPSLMMVQVGTFLWMHPLVAIAPILWLIGFVSAFCLAFVKRSEQPMYDHRQRRFFSKHLRKPQRPRAPSIWTYGFHRRYPLALRSLGHFLRGKPQDATTRATQAQISRLHQDVLLLRRQVARLRRLCPDPILAVPRREGGREKGNNTQHRTSCEQRHAKPMTQSEAKLNHQSSRTPYHHRGSCNLKYEPVPAHCHHGFGNNNCTTRQYSHVMKKVAAVYMTTFQTTAMPPMAPFTPEQCMRIAMLSPMHLQKSMTKCSTFTVIWDSRASICISPDRQDFAGPLERPSIVTTLQGLTKGLKIEAQGHVLWSFQDTKGQLRSLKIRAYLVPKAQVRLLSTSGLLQAYPDETITIESHRLTLSGTSDPTRGSIIARIDPSNNLPTTLAYRYSDAVETAQGLNAVVTTVSQSNFNLSEPQKELLRWHFRLGHVSMQTIQFLMCSGVLAQSEAQATSAFAKLQAKGSGLSKVCGMSIWKANAPTLTWKNIIGSL